MATSEQKIKPRNTILVGHTLSSLKTVADNHFHNCVTSPPYYGLREYKTEPIVWNKIGGCPDVYHVWEEHNLKKSNNNGTGGGTVVQKEGVNNETFGKSWTCKECGAWKGQLGQEPTDDMFIEHLCQIFDEVKRTLHPMGSCWVNLGDSRADDTSFRMIPERFAQAMKKRGWILRAKIIWVKDNAMPQSDDTTFTTDYEFFYFFVKDNKAPLFWTNDKLGKVVSKKPVGTNGVEGVDWEWRQPKTAINDDTNETKIEAENAQSFGSPRARLHRKGKNWVRGEAIGKEPGTYWRKATLWRGHRYFFTTQYQPYSEVTIKEALKDYKGGDSKDYDGTKAQNPGDTKRRIIESVRTSIKFGGNKAPGYGNPVYSGNEWDASPLGRIMRSVWHINTKGLADSHFAPYPEDLIKIPIDACTPKHICKKCGLPRTKIFDQEFIPTRPGETQEEGVKSRSEDDPNKTLHSSDWSRLKPVVVRTQQGYTVCECENPEYEHGIVLDPFLGSGTTMAVSYDMDRDAVGCELNPEFVQIAEKRIGIYNWLQPK